MLAAKKDQSCFAVIFYIVTNLSVVLLTSILAFENVFVTRHALAVPGLIKTSSLVNSKKCLLKCHSEYDDPHDFCVPECYYELFSDDYFWSWAF